MGESMTNEERADRPRLYKVTYHGGERHWCLRLPDWIGRVLDWRHNRKWGFAP